MRRNYRGNIANEKACRACNIYDEARRRSWRVSLNSFGVNSRILRTGVLRDRQWEACG